MLYLKRKQDTPPDSLRKGEMIMKMEFYRCKHCGQIVAMVKKTGVPIICCGEPMEQIIPGTADASPEKLW